MSNLTRFDTVVVGGGITGMRAAQLEALAGKRVAIVSAEFGGLIGNQAASGFNFDIGGHVYTTGDQRVVDLMKAAGGVVHEQRKAFYIGADGSFVPYPVQSHVDRLGLEILPSGNGAYEGKSLASWAIKTFGIEFYEGWFRPFNQRVWTTDPAIMSSDWIASRVQTPREAKPGWGPNASFIYAPGDRIVSQLTASLMHLGVTMLRKIVKHVDLQHKVAYLGVAGGQLAYNHLIDTTGMFMKPFVRTNRVVTLGVGLDQKLPLDFHWLYANIAKRAHRVTLLSRYHPANAPADCDSLIIEYPYWSHRDLPVYAQRLTTDLYDEPRWNMLNSADAALALHDLGIPILRGIDRRNIIAGLVSDARGYPVPTMGARRMVSNIKHVLDMNDVFSCGRWGSHGYFNVDHCFTDAKATVEYSDHRRADSEGADHYFHASFYYQRSSDGTPEADADRRQPEPDSPALS